MTFHTLLLAAKAFVLGGMLFAYIWEFFAIQKQGQEDLPM
jgi:hypothetical protein